MSGYSFYCSRCKFDHAGECQSIRPRGEPIGGTTKTSDLITALEELVKALEAGSYNAKPVPLHQCRQDGKCGVPGCDPSIT